MNITVLKSLQLKIQWNHGSNSQIDTSICQSTFQCYIIYDDNIETKTSLSAAQSLLNTSLEFSVLVPVGSDGSSYLINIDDTSVNWSTLSWTLLYIKIQVEA